MVKTRFFAKAKGNENRSLIRFVQILYALFELIGLPKYKSKYSKRTFSSWQLLALLVLRAKSRLSVEDFVEQWLPCATLLHKKLGLMQLPSASCLRKFAGRLKAGWLHKALAGCPAFLHAEALLVGIDGTGSSKQRGSRHYYRRIGKRTTKKDFVKAVALSDMKSQLMIAVKIRKKVRHDNVDFQPCVNKAARAVKIDVVVGDKGFDAQKNHDLVHKHKALLITPLRNEKVPVWRTKGADRKKLKRSFPKKKYHQRSKCETVFSVVKRKTGDFVTAIKFGMQKIELLCRFLAYNIDRLLVQKSLKNPLLNNDETTLKVTTANAVVTTR